MGSTDINIANLPTKSVTFTPTTAAVVREIPVSIQVCRLLHHLISNKY